MDNILYEIEEVYQQIKSPNGVISQYINFSGTYVLNCKDNAEFTYLSRLAGVGKPSFNPNFILSNVLLYYSVTTKEGSKRFCISHPKGFFNAGEEIYAEEEILKRMTGEDINIPIWPERLKQLKERYNYKE